jgi:phosphoglycolate phosphatase-like HAD superfamily hydrolase
MNLWLELQQRLETIDTSERPQIILDIDDTLIDCRYRKHQVFRDFLQQPHILAEFPLESERLILLNREDVCYRIEDNLNKVSIQSKEFAKAIFQFWKAHYFTYPYLIHDQAFPGAVNFVQRLEKLGVRVIYLTGRDRKNMEQGTLTALQNLGFPVDGSHIHFYFKPDIGMEDHLFKISVLDHIKQLGPVLAALENELPNLNAMADKFSDALMYWRPTLYAPNPPPPHERVKFLREFPD